MSRTLLSLRQPESAASAGSGWASLPSQVSTEDHEMAWHMRNCCTLVFCTRCVGSVHLRSCQYLRCVGDVAAMGPLILLLLHMSSKGADRNSCCSWLGEAVVRLPLHK